MARLLFSLSLLKGLATLYCSTADQAPVCKHETEAIVIAPDGMASLVDIDSGDILWSFSSGTAIYSSSRQGENLDEGYIDCGDDWKLYFHKDCQKRLITVEELVNRPPFQCATGTMITSKNISTFHVKPKTGEIVRTYTSDNVSLVQGHSSLSRSYEGRVPTRSMDNEVLFFVTRTDYTIKYTCFKSEEVLWGVMFADIDVSYLFQSNEMEECLFRPSMDCQKKPVYRLRVGSPLASYFVAKTPQAALPQPTAASTSSSDSNHRKIPVDLIPDFQLAVAPWLRNATNEEKKSKKAQSGQEKQENSIRFSNDTVINDNLIVTDKEIAKGSNGTIVFEGEYHERLVAVKRLPKTPHNLAVKERNHLNASDHHANIVRCFGVESDGEFDYICLERCICSLYDLILNKARDRNAFELVKNGLRLWKDGFPSEELLKLMRDIACGVAHMHKLRIVHRDLKPQDILIVKDPFISAKISDLGMSEKLDGYKKYLTQHAIGCIFHFCMTKGQHPFGEDPERHHNIVYDRKKMSLVKRFPEAYDLISGLLQSDPKLRTKVKDVIHHPLFWDSKTRMSFFQDVGDKVENESPNSPLSMKLVKIQFGTKRWDGMIDQNLLADRLKHRKYYNFMSVRHLIRLIRNTVNHRDEHSEGSRKILGQYPQGYDRYFSTQFPSLLIDVYKAILEHCADNNKETSDYFSAGM